MLGEGALTVTAVVADACETAPRLRLRRALSAACVHSVLLHDGALWTLRAIESIPMTKAEPPEPATCLIT